MGASSSNLTDAACAVHLFKINGYSATRAMANADSLPSQRLAVGGYDWEVHYTPSFVHDADYWIAFRLVLLAAPRRNNVKAALKCRLLDASGQLRPAVSNTRDANAQLNAGECQLSHAFKRADESSRWLPLRQRSVLEASGCIKEDSFTVECTVTVITEQPPDTTHVLPRRQQTGSSQSSLRHDLGELLLRGTGSDVTLVVSGESFAAHKAILASRSPVFMAQFFGHMKETRSQRVEIKDMKAAVFRAMLGFIYTDITTTTASSSRWISSPLRTCMELTGSNPSVKTGSATTPVWRRLRRFWHWRSSMVAPSSRLGVLSSSLQTLMLSWRPRGTRISWQTLRWF